ncbi:hypothetical protein BASA81_010019 [Batrachochytrium salamandrivorans]|nr:hypothetical protein BASA81_010019 [Batrachochytrium salamandrivorans]
MLPKPALWPLFGLVLAGASVLLLPVYPVLGMVLAAGYVVLLAVGFALALVSLVKFGAIAALVAVVVYQAVGVVAWLRLVALRRQCIQHRFVVRVEEDNLVCGSCGQVERGGLECSQCEFVLCHACDHRQQLAIPITTSRRLNQNVHSLAESTYCLVEVGDVGFKSYDDLAQRVLELAAQAGLDCDFTCARICPYPQLLEEEAVLALPLAANGERVLLTAQLVDRATTDVLIMDEGVWVDLAQSLGTGGVFVLLMVESGLGAARYCQRAISHSASVTIELHGRPRSRHVSRSTILFCLFGASVLLTGITLASTRFASTTKQRRTSYL